VTLELSTHEKLLKLHEKNILLYKERDEQKRVEFIAEIEVLPEDNELYYADESGFDECYAREYGYAPRGKKVIGEISSRKFERTSIVAAKKGKEIFATFAFKGTMDGDLFEGWLEEVLVPEFKNPEKSVIILDNASPHKKTEFTILLPITALKYIFHHIRQTSTKSRISGLMSKIV